MRPHHHRRGQKRAFSLFEIVVAMAIVGLISGTVFSILWQAGDTAAEIRELDRRDEEVDRFLSLLRESIENLPQDGTLELKPAEETTSGYPELLIGNSATAFVFGETVGSSEETVISLRPSVDPRSGEASFDLALSRGDFAPEDTDGSGMAMRAGTDDFLQSDEDGRYWLPLLTGVTAAAWNFWDEEQATWLEEWTDDSKMPPLLAFSFTDGYRAVPLRVVFEVPEPLSNPQAAAETTTTGTTGSTASGSDRQGGGRPGGGERRPGGGEGRPGGGEGRPGGGEGRPGGGEGRPGGGEGRPGGGEGRPGGGPGGSRPGGGGPGGGGGPSGGGPGGGGGGR